MRARLLRNILALISIAAIFTQCESKQTQKENINLDSLIKIKEKRQLDSIAKMDSINNAKNNSIIQFRNDSIPKSKNQIVPTYLPPEKPVCDYGPMPYEPSPATTRYGSPSILD